MATYLRCKNPSYLVRGRSKEFSPSRPERERLASEHLEQAVKFEDAMFENDYSQVEDTVWHRAEPSDSRPTFGADQAGEFRPKCIDSSGNNFDGMVNRCRK